MLDKIPLGLKGIIMSIAFGAIRAHQKALFGRDSEYRDTHTTIFVNEFETMSVEPPRATYIPLKAYCLDRISIYRYNKKAITQADAKTMMDAYDQKIYGSEYDFLQLPDIALSQIFKGPTKYKSFLSKKNQAVVCSVGAYASYEAFCKKHKLPVIFSKADIKVFDSVHPHWSKKKLEGLNKKDSDDWNAISPAHFANSEFFNNEFDFVGEYNHGMKIK